MFDSLSDRQRQVIFIALFVIATLAMATLVWFVLLRPLNQRVANENGNANAANTNGVLPNINDAGPRPIGNANINVNGSLPTISPIASGAETLETVLTDHSTGGLQLSASGVQFYDRDDQRFYRLDANGNLVRLSDQQFFEATDVVFSPNGDQAIISYPDTNNIFYNFKTGQQSTLPREMNEFSFSKDGKQIAFEFEEEGAPENNFIGVANPDGTSVQVIEPLGEKEFDVAVDFAPHQEIVATFRKGIDADRQEVFFIGRNKENFLSLQTDGRNFEGTYSPTGQQMLYSVYNPESNYQPELHIVNSQGNNIGVGDVNLGIKTWSNKCSFGSGSSIYCAVPTGLERGAGMYPELADDNSDEIYRIDTLTGHRTRIAIPVNERGEKSSSIDQMVVSNDGSILYYTDRETQELKSIRLK